MSGPSWTRSVYQRLGDGQRCVLVALALPLRAIAEHSELSPPDWSGPTKTAGLVAAMGGSLAGAWLGFHATAGLLALITTIVGATVGAKLLIVLGMTWERWIGSRFPSDAEATSVARHGGADRAAALPRTEP